VAAPEVGSEARKSRVATALDSSVFKRALYRAVVLQPLILAVIAGVLLYKIDRLLAALGWAEPTSAVVEQAHRVRELLVNMEFGLRGFLTSGEADLFTRYREAATQAPDALRELERRILQHDPALALETGELGVDFRRTGALRASAAGQHLSRGSAGEAGCAGRRWLSAPARVSESLAPSAMVSLNEACSQARVDSAPWF